MENTQQREIFSLGKRLCETLLNARPERMGNEERDAILRIREQLGIQSDSVADICDVISNLYNTLQNDLEIVYGHEERYPRMYKYLKGTFLALVVAIGSNLCHIDVNREREGPAICQLYRQQVDPGIPLLGERMFTKSGLSCDIELLGTDTDLFNTIVDHVYSTKMAGIQTVPTATMLLGAPGAGKGYTFKSLLRNHSDDIKHELASRVSVHATPR